VSAQSTTAEDEALANRYRPLLVMFPEIREGSRRGDHHHDVANEPDEAGPRPGRPPLDMDYHPRDIRLVLDNALPPFRARLRRSGSLRAWKDLPEEERRRRLLRAMAGNKIPHIDLVDRRGPRDVDNFWRVYAAIEEKDARYPRRAYARVVRGRGPFEDYISIQYWLAYFFDDWANVHEMDWEMVSVILRKTGAAETPVAGVFCAHIGAFRKPWPEVDKADEAGMKDPAGKHPVAYIANGSHASYFSDYPSYFNVAEPYLRPGLRTLVRALGVGRPFTDYIPGFEQGERRFPEVSVIPENEDDWTGEWSWLKFTGNWGSPVRLSLFERLLAPVPIVRHLPSLFRRPIREAGPRGPNTRGTCWRYPFDWANLECLDAPEDRNWLERQYRVRGPDALEISL
jgi:hypothetical protein